MDTRKYLLVLLAVTIAAAQPEPRPQPRPPITFTKKLWGWADLHTHPASHLSFGNDEDGNGGMFWGKPGGKWDPAEKDLDKDLPACSFKHGADDLDLVRHEVHKALMENLDAVTNYPHQTGDFGNNNAGHPSFKHWPHAHSITHQQMHISQIRRAYDGGQRLMIASMTNNEFLSDMWTQIGYNFAGNPVPAVDPEFGYNSVKRQIAFIREQAKLNSSWMQVVTSPAGARAAIEADKMAIIISVEMDSLTYDQIIKLVLYDDVRHIIPIHLADNDFGGTAVYSDAFNSVNNFLHSSRNGGDLNNDGFFKVVFDPKFAFRLSRPVYPSPIKWDVIKGGGITLESVSDEVWGKLGYEKEEGGHRNARGLSDTGKKLLLALARIGVLIDVVHMSARSMRDSLDLAKEWGYPMMNSHTGIRKVSGIAENERLLNRAHAQIISDLGGVIGLGTDWPEGLVTLVPNQTALAPYYANLFILNQEGSAFKTSQHAWKHLPTLPGNPELAHLAFRIKTGSEDLSGDLFADYTIKGVNYSQRLNVHHEQWRPWLVTTPHFALPAGTRSSDLTEITLRVDKGDQYSVAEFELRAVPKTKDPVGTWLDAFKDGLTIMDGKGMAIGTDINGFAGQLMLAADEVVYPVQAARKFGRPNAPLLGQDHLGERVFSFKKDGIAHYGMLPDFIEALSQKPESADAMNALFHSANDVVVMWEKCNKVGGTLY